MVGLGLPVQILLDGLVNHSDDVRLTPTVRYEFSIKDIHQNVPGLVVCVG